MRGRVSRVAAWTLAAAWLAGAAAARAAVPDAALFPFLGSPATPASAASAGVALADRWLGDLPYDNPAFTATRGLELSPALIHPSRQDLRAANRNYVETSGYLDGAGGWIAVPLKRLTLFGYASQPVLRFEDNSFTRGTVAVDPANPPAMIATQAEAREVRAGGGLSWGDSGFRVGLAGEWTHRDDSYQVVERSGSPLAGTLTTTISGEGVGLQAGARRSSGRAGPHPLTVGLGVRFLPALTLTARDVLEPLAASGDTTDYDAGRDASWEGGASASVGVSPTFALTAATGMSGRQTWSGLGVDARTGFLWSIGGAFHDPAGPWTMRFGYGQQSQPGAPEPRTGLLGLGLGYSSEGMRVELGALRRSVRRGASPTSYDDRVIASVGITF